jgi:hypothetical protein
MVLETEIKKWEGFLRALRQDDRAAFEEMMNHCRNHASTAGAAVRPIVTDAMFMSILLSHEKIIKEIKAALEKEQILTQKDKQ